MKPAYLAMPIMLGLAGCNSTTTMNQEVTSLALDPMDSFVVQQEDQLLLNNQPFRFAGTNNYYMHYKSNDMITAVLDDAQEMGLNSIRVWGFMEGISHNHTMQPEAGDYTPPAGVKSALERLDFTIAEAKKRGIRVVVALTNNWGDFGGMPQYVEWFGGSHHDDFYRNPEIKQSYKDYVKHIIGHTNRYTGVPNSEEPAIMTWELGNEPRAQSDKSGELLYQWTKEMSDYVRSLAPNQLIALGSEGFFTRPGHEDWAYNGNEGVDWERILTLPNISYGTFHLYPEHWGKHDAEQWGTQWIIEHAQAAKAANKPAVLEEYGIGKNEPQNRDFIYRKWTQTAYEQGLAGSMFWILTSYEPDQKENLYPDYDGFRVLNDGGRTTQILLNHSKQMRGFEYQDNDSVFLTYPVDQLTVSEPNFTVKSYPMASEGNQVKSVTLRLPDSDQSFEMLDSDGDGYYELDLSAETTGYGERRLVTVATFEQGARQTDKITIKVDRPIKGYEVGTAYDFADGKLSGWESEGTWQAKWQNPSLEVSDELGSPMLKLNIEWSGKNDWEELKLRNMSIPKFGQHTKLKYVLYVPVNEGDKGGVRPYAALGDGWVKIGTDTHRTTVDKLEKVTLGGKQYYKQPVEIDLGDVSTKLPDLFLCIVGDKFPLTGSVFIDNIELLKPVY
ncbi:cellulase family glycosylhydrolase [Vibrio sp. SCSIO 43136]|uniref:cellulase family glycosylhydrolase n=1 Tax=Vibrio sp. SCSIO 43136 TaxID=2819101 RepID=UPI002074BF99|nr:cellulase family glycosylhydrolase [Vibrio sp. SCSIO 43136]USD67391.1 cellulase family glycosylhydrolase [Vibrio sp. SCSIO 43136]